MRTSTAIIIGAVVALCINVCGFGLASLLGADTNNITKSEWMVLIPSFIALSSIGGAGVTFALLTNNKG